MNLIGNIFPLSHVFLEMDVSSKKRIFEQVGIFFENSLGIARSVTFDSLFNREKQGSTGLGQGVAIPHARIKGLKEATCAFIRLKSPISFDAPDLLPVSLLFILLVPVHATETHLQILSELAQLFSDKKARARLMTEPDTIEIWNFISTWEPYATDHC